MRSKAVVYSILSILFAAAVFVVAWMYFRFIMGKETEEQPEKTYSHYYAMVTDDYKSSFWQYVWKGAAEEAARNDSYVELFGADLGYDYSVEELMEMAMAAKVDGIMVYGNSSESMVDMIAKAAKEGIPVVTMYSDSPYSERCSYVGVSGYNIGLEYGRQICNATGEIQRLALQDPARKKAVYNVTVLVEEKKPFYDQNVILSGIKDIINREGSGTEYAIKLVNVDNSNPFSVEESIRDIFMEEEIPDIMVCLSELDTTCAYQALIDFNLVGSVYILGYYNSENILNAISRNVVYSTLAVDTEELGRYCAEAMDEYINYGNTSQYFAADVTIIDKTNVAEYLHKEEPDEK